MQRSFTSQEAAEMLVAPQLTGLLADAQRQQWRFPPQAIELIEQRIEELTSGDYLA